jgi:hypothetical protein
MEKQDIQQLLARLNSGESTEAERKELEKLLEAGLVSLEDIEGLHFLDQQILRMETPSPGARLDQRFYQLLSSENRKKKSSWRKFYVSWPEFAPKLAIASLTLILGFVAGYLLRPASNNPGSQQIEVLSQQVSDLQEMMMLSLLEKGSATDRLKAVNLTQEMSEASMKVTNALIHTLNQDENVNVRLAALDALKPYTRDSSVRAALIRSISKQESPLVQISLAELMAALQEKSALKEFEKIVESDNTPADVKKRIKENLEVLI